MRRALVTVVLASAVVTRAPGAHAQDQNAAEALYREGQRLIDAGKLHDACAKFAESQRIEAAAGTELATAACHEKEGKVASAWAEFQEAVVLAQRAREPARERYARAHATALEASLYRVVFDAVSPPAGFEIKVDGRVLAMQSLSAGVPLDPGTHHVDGTAPGCVPWSRDLTVPGTAGTEHVSVTLSPVPSPAALAPPEPARRSLVAPVSVAAGGLGAAIVGGVLLGVASIDGNDAKRAAAAATNTAAYQNASHERDSALTLQTAGIIVGGVGLVAAAVGGVWIVRSTRVAPTTLGLRGGGVAVEGTF